MFHTLLLLFYRFYVHKSYCYSVMYVPVMPASAYTALAFVFGFIQIKLMMMILRVNNGPCRLERADAAPAVWRPSVDR